MPPEARAAANRQPGTQRSECQRAGPASIRDDMFPGSKVMSVEQHSYMHLPEASANAPSLFPDYVPVVEAQHLLQIVDPAGRLACSCDFSPV